MWYNPHPRLGSVVSLWTANLLVMIVGGARLKLWEARPRGDYVLN